MGIKAGLKDFVAELRRRRVTKASVAYLVAAWLVIEITALVFPALLLPEWSHRLVVILAVAAFPVVVLLAWVFDISPDGIRQTKSLADPNVIDAGVETSRIAAAAPMPPPEASAIASICVLPFEVLSSDPEDRYIAQGVCVEISSALSKLAGVRVVPRASTSAADIGIDLRELRHRLGARYVLTGSLRRRGRQIRIVAELADAEAGVQLWSETYHRILDDVMEVEEAIAGAIVGSFGGEQLREEIKRANKGETKSQTAWSLVHKARAFVLNYSQETLNEAESLARQAIELDPDYAVAHAALADALSERITSGLSDRPSEDIGEAVNAIGKAVAAAPDDPFVLKLAGNVWRLVGQHQKAVECLRRAVEISSHDLGAWGYLASALAVSGTESQLAEADSILDHILEMAPNHPGAGFWWHHKALVSTCRGDFDATIAYAETALQKQQGLVWAWYLKANAMASVGNANGAREALVQAEAANNKLTYEKFSELVTKTSATQAIARRRLAGLESLMSS